MKSAHSN